MSISTSDVRQMRSRIQDALMSPKKRQRSRKRRVSKIMQEQLSLGDFLVSMLNL